MTFDEWWARTHDKQAFWDKSSWYAQQMRRAYEQGYESGYQEGHEDGVYHEKVNAPGDVV